MNKNVEGDTGQSKRKIPMFGISSPGHESYCKLQLGGFPQLSELPRFQLTLPYKEITILENL
jgi:hypothetical protein